MVSVSGHRLRVLVFMDYSNFRPSMERTEAGFQIGPSTFRTVLGERCFSDGGSYSRVGFPRYAYVRVVRPVQQSREVSTALVQ